MTSTDQASPAGRSPNLSAQLDPIFQPRSIAIIGASNRAGMWGFNLLNRLLKGSYPGAIYPVNPREAQVQGLRAYGRVGDLPERVDLAVLAVPAPQVAGVLQECIDAGAGGALVITAGFAESGEEGAALQAEVVAVARAGRIRFVGPNCMGISNPAAGLALAGAANRPGPIAFVSQSGAFGGYLMAMAEAKGVGVSKFVSSGNQADLGVADYVEYLAADPQTRVIVLYLEGLPEGRRFLEIARRVTPHKPIVVYKAGRTTVGARSVRSHTASLMIPEGLFEGLCAQAGLVRVNDTAHIFDIAEALAKAPLPKGRGVGIMSMTGGNAVVASDTCSYLGLEVPDLDEETQEHLRRRVLAPHAPAPRNPVDLAGDFSTPIIYAEATEVLARLDYIHGLIVTPPGGQDPRALEATRRIAAIPSQYGKPLLAIGRPTRDDPCGQVLQEAGIPIYPTPEDGARAMRALVTYAEARQALGAL